MDGARANDATVVIVPTGSANLASVAAALRRCGLSPRIDDDPRRIAEASRVVLPGVGSFAAAMERLRCRGADRAVAARVREGRPTLAICLGLQLLCRSSAESPGATGLGVVDAAVEALPPLERLPHMGWNRVEAPDDRGVVRDMDAYFAHSFALRAAPLGWRTTMARHGGPFVAAIERGAVVACQFHPELSGDAGAALLRRWLLASPIPNTETVPC